MNIQWPSIISTLLIALGAGTFAAVAVTEWWGKAERARGLGALTALIALIAGASITVFSFGHPERFLLVLGHLGTSTSNQMLALILVGAAALVYVAAPRMGYSAAASKGIATVGLGLAVLAAFTAGYAYVLPSRPAWNTLLLPLLFMAYAGVLGCFALFVCAVVRGETESTVASINRAALIAVALQALLLVAYLLYLALAPNADPTRSATRLLTGDLAPLIWIGAVVVGLGVPAGLTGGRIAGKLHLASLAVALAGLICALLGVIAFRIPLDLLGSSIQRF